MGVNKEKGEKLRDRTRFGPHSSPLIPHATRSFDRFVHQSGKTWHETIARIEKRFDSFDVDRNEFRKKAEEVARLTDDLDDMLEAMTSGTCPACRQVCCINRHSWPDESDLIYLLALGATPPPYEENLDENGPCRFLSALGCTIPRSQRPFRCNWYFCEPLIAEMDRLPGRIHRNFSEGFSRLVEIRKRLIDAFVADPPAPA